MKNLFFILSIAALIGLASCDKSDDVFVQQQEEVSVDESESTLKSTLPRWIFDRNKTAQYAYQYTEEGVYSNGNIIPSRVYRTTKYNNAEYKFWYKHDCTNFVSQALREGRTNKAMAPNWLYNDHNTSDTSDDGCSGSWNDAHTQFEFFTNNYFTKTRTFLKGQISSRTSLTYKLLVRDLRLGDLIYFDYSDNGDYNHVMIVTKISGEIPNKKYYLSGHSYNQRNDELFWILSGMSSDGKVTSLAF
jgi:hypothetical protein